MEPFLSTPPGPLRPHPLVDNFDGKLHNLVRGLSTARLNAIQAIAVARFNAALA